MSLRHASADTMYAFEFESGVQEQVVIYRYQFGTLLKYTSSYLKFQDYVGSSRERVYSREEGPRSGLVALQYLVVGMKRNNQKRGMKKSPSKRGRNQENVVSRNPRRFS